MAKQLLSLWLLLFLRRCLLTKGTFGARENQTRHDDTETNAEYCNERNANPDAYMSRTPAFFKTAIPQVSNNISRALVEFRELERIIGSIDGSKAKKKQPKR